MPTKSCYVCGPPLLGLMHIARVSVRFSGSDFDEAPAVTLRRVLRLGRDVFMRDLWHAAI